MSASTESASDPRTDRLFSFELQFRFSPDIPEFSDQMLDALFENGCCDALVGQCCGRPYIAFSRMAPTFRDALLSAIADVERADVGIEPTGIEMEHEEPARH